MLATTHGYKPSFPALSLPRHRVRRGTRAHCRSPQTHGLDPVPAHRDRPHLPIPSFISTLAFSPSPFPRCSPPSRTPSCRAHTTPARTRRIDCRQHQAHAPGRVMRARRVPALPSSLPSPTPPLPRLHPLSPSAGRPNSHLATQLHYVHTPRVPMLSLVSTLTCPASLSVPVAPARAPRPLPVPGLRTCT
ncbi:hypothetical protein B0H16DRAFT_1622510 [Mycena metata]|uniref:Uncharacterized protein n=1 Tax=Mycena metata TaxID=1033252 RepID=A0AAD7H5S9_9AGAR|nr:hypothetical protein B0H16DRAFT_1622510 [Mycena metata]